ncbi:UDP-glucose 6-dehydrogenase [Pseudomonas syringae pv. syringae]|nr:UDP-glucose 6-dehydrogenase [Pseudomonas syringae pv. syringae]
MSGYFSWGVRRDPLPGNPVRHGQCGAGQRSAIGYALEHEPPALARSMARTAQFDAARSQCPDGRLRLDHCLCALHAFLVAGPSGLAPEPCLFAAQHQLRAGLYARRSTAVFPRDIHGIENCGCHPDRGRCLDHQPSARPPGHHLRIFPMKISVFGSGYVGLVQATVLAEVGHDVVCMDIDQAKIDQLRQGQVHIYEPGLANLVRENLDQQRLCFTTDEQLAVEHAEVLFIAVGTPSRADGSADLSGFFAVGEAIARHRREPLIIVEKSTVPVGSGDALRNHVDQALRQAGRLLQFDIVSNPEFLKEGSAVNDCRRPDRIVIGCDNEAVRNVMRELYAPFNRNHERIMFMDLRSAELTKYAANCMLATKISFINQIAELAEHLGADVESVRLGIGADSRIGYDFIYPGCGYGGSCFGKDIRALIHSAREAHCSNDLLSVVEAINERQKNKLFERVNAFYQGDLRGKTFALWGLAFKPNTDDMRDAPSRVLMEALWEAGASVRAFDPEAMQETQRIYGHREDLMLMGTPESALNEADALIVCTEWQQFKAPDFELIQQRLNAPIIFDGRNLYDTERLAKRGFHYFPIGRGESCDLPIPQKQWTACNSFVSSQVV